MLFALALPVLVLAALAALIMQGRPIFFGHRRLGRGGTPIVCWKLRTMHVGAEDQLEDDTELGRRYRKSGFKLPSAEDPRVTRLGKWLRKTYVDEIPQLFNVLRGDLALVGPRPIVEDELALFGDHQAELLSVRPGIVGAWACMGPARPPYPERAEIELAYVRRRTIAGDVMILLQSVGAVLQGEPAESPPGAPPTESDASPGPDSDGALRRILSNANALLFAYLLPRGFSFVSVVVAARALGISDFGAYGTAAAYAVILSIVATLGMTPLLIRDIAQDPERAPRLIRAAHIVKTVANVFMLVLLVLIARLLGYDSEVVSASLVLGLGYALGAYAENLSAYYQAHERMYVWTQASAIFGLVSGLAGIAIVLATRDIVLFCISPALGWAAALAWLLVRAPPEVRWGESASFSEISRLFRSLLPFAAGFALMVVYYKVDVLMLSAWRSPEDVGVYSASYKFVDLFQALMVVASGAVYPRLSALARRRASLGASAGARSTEMLLLAAIPAAGFTYFLATPLIAFLYGPTYAEAARVLALLALVFPFLAVTIHGGYVLAASGRMATVAGLYAAALAANWAMNVALIPTRGAEGAAISMLVSEGALAVGFLWALHRQLDAAPGRAVLGAVLLGYVGGASVSMLAESVGPYLSAITFSAFLVVLYPLTGAFGLREVKVLAAMMKPARGGEVGP